MILRKEDPNMNEQGYIDDIPNANQALINHLIDNRNGNTSTFPEQCPVEINPYKREVELQNFDKYVIGTHPPISYILDDEEIVCEGIVGIIKPNGEIESRPTVNYFHGNRGSMWDLLLGEFFFEFDQNNDELRAEKKTDIISYLQNNRINYSDIIDSLRRQYYNADDKSLKNIVLNNDLIKHIFENPNLDRILFNTSSAFSSNGFKLHINNVAGGVQGRINVSSKCSAFDLFFRGCQELGMKIEFKVERPNNQIDLDWTEVSLANALILGTHLRTKIIFKARVTVPRLVFDNKLEIVKKFFVFTPFSPAARGNVQNNPIVSNWLNNNVGLNRNVLLTQIYQKFVRFNQEDKLYLMTLNHF